MSCLILVLLILVSTSPYHPLLSVPDPLAWMIHLLKWSKDRGHVICLSSCWQWSRHRRLAIVKGSTKVEKGTWVRTAVSSRWQQLRPQDHQSHILERVGTRSQPGDTLAPAPAGKEERDTEWRTECANYLPLGILQTRVCMEIATVNMITAGPNFHTEENGKEAGTREPVSLIFLSSATRSPHPI